MSVITEIRNVRPPAVAGRFYPADPTELSRAVDAYLEDAEATPHKTTKAIIGPHAGYVFSGPIAGTAYRALDAIDRDAIRRVVLIGPSHRVAFRGVATTEHTHFRTPLGDVPIDHEALRAIASIPGVMPYESAHAMEHGLEVHLPFLQKTLHDFTVVPLVAGQDSDRVVRTVLERLWGGPETLIVISSDLSHYYDYGMAKMLDHATSQAIENLDAPSVTSRGACGAVPVRGLIEVAREKGLSAETLDVRNSGDTAGGKDQVVGYGAYAFFQE